jgi:hypothetical protein
VNLSLIPALKASRAISRANELAGKPKLHSLGWDEVAIDYHSLQIAIACIEADTK